jgi:hypothetical protein
MPRTKDTLKIDVEERTDGDTRLITVHIAAPAHDLLLAELLQKRGAIESLEASLKQTVRETVQRYIEGTEELIAGLAAVQRKSGNGAKHQAKMELEKEASGAKNGNGDRGAERSSSDA